MDLTPWLVAELDETAARLRSQVLDLVPPDRRFERPGGGNSIVWNAFHVARHADTALQVLGGRASGGPPVPPGGGLQEAEQPWADKLDPADVDAYGRAVFAATRKFLVGVTPEGLDRVPDVAAVLAELGIEADEFGWLYRMWAGQSAAFLVRWPLLGHVGNHVGEMIAIRNRMGLSPF